MPEIGLLWFQRLIGAAEFAGKRGGLIWPLCRYGLAEKGAVLSGGAKYEENIW